MSDFKEIDSLNGPDSVCLSQEDLDAMTAEELEAALALVLDSMTDQSYDGDAISAYLNALERKSPMPEFPDAQTSYSRFKRKLHSVGFNEPVTHKRRISRRVLTVFLAAVLILCLFTAQALGADIFGRLARWTSDVFSFGEVDHKPSEQVVDDQTNQARSSRFSDTLPSEYQELWTELEAKGITNFLYPTYLPAGFQLLGNDLQCFPEFNTVDFVTWYTNEDSKITFSILLSNTQHRTYEKDKGDVEIYETNGIVHYIFSNNGKKVATWYSDEIEYSLSMYLPVSELKKMIDSLYEE